MTRKLLTFLTLLLLGISASAQVYSYGNDPASTKWNTIYTDSYRLVYPQELDSLARVYAYNLEKYKLPVGGSLGYVPNENYRKPMPVILHPYTAYSNAMVMWAPRRMEMLTTPEAYGPEALDWVRQLTIHENRHVAQMQFANQKGEMRFLRTLTGDFTGSLVSVYPGLTFLEGDAVCTETALTNVGRGRDGSFMEYYRVAFAEGDYRNYWKWMWGSQRHYTPDYYRAGYMLHAGMRSVYNTPDFSSIYYDRAFNRDHKPLFLPPMFVLQSTVKDISGKRLKDAFREIEDAFQKEWEASEQRRGPFITGTEVTKPGRYYEKYSGLTYKNGRLWAVRSGMARNSELISIDSTGKLKRERFFSSNTSSLKNGLVTNRLYWTELKADTRWSLRNYSDLRYLENGKVHNLTSKTRYFNPAPCPVDSLVAVVEYLPSGRNNVVVLSEADGSVVKSFRAPDGYQPVNSAWIGDNLFVSAITEDGFSIYDIQTWEPIFTPGPFKIKALFTRDNRIWFTSDMDGVFSLYSLDVASGNVWQETSTRFGADEYTFNGDTLYFVAPGTKGRNIYKTVEDSLIGTKAAYDKELYAIANKFAAAEPEPEDIEVNISEPEPYSKFKHLFKFHSWAPLYLNYDFVSVLTYQDTQVKGALGAMALFQNDLGTSYGSVGVALGDETFSSFRPSFHLQYTWAGWVPKFELRVDYNSRNALLYGLDIKDDKIKQAITSKDNTQYLFGGLRAYIPINLSSGAWSRGIVPELAVTGSSDVFYNYIYDDNRFTWSYGLFTSAKISAYSVLPTPTSCIMPRLGLGGSVSLVYMPLIHHLYPGTLSGTIYGYLPGVYPTHSIRLQAGASTSVGGTFIKQDDLSFVAEYAMPFAAVDWTFLCPAFYIKNFELIARAGYEYSKTTALQTSASSSTGNTTVGGTLRVRLANFLWVPYDTRIGYQYIYNVSNPDLSTHGIVFTLDI